MKVHRRGADASLPLRLRYRLRATGPGSGFSRAAADSGPVRKVIIDMAMTSLERRRYGSPLGLPGPVSPGHQLRVAGGWRRLQGCCRGWKAGSELRSGGGLGRRSLIRQPSAPGTSSQGVFEADGRVLISVTSVTCIYIMTWECWVYLATVIDRPAARAGGARPRAPSRQGRSWMAPTSGHGRSRFADLDRLNTPAGMSRALDRPQQRA